MASPYYAYSVYGQPDVADLAEHREKSWQLERWRVGDFQDMPALVKKHITDPALTANDGIRLRYPPVIMRQSKDGSQQYVLAPERTFSLPGGGKPSDVQAAAYAKLYRDLGVDQFLRQAQEKSYSQNHALICLIPDRKRPGRGRLMSFLSYEVEGMSVPDPTEPDLWCADSVTLSVPWATVDNRCHMGRLTLTDTSAVLSGPDNETRNVYGLDSPEHAFSGCPVVGVRLSEPSHRGYWLPALAEDLWALQVMMVVATSDIEDMIRETAAGLSVLAGQNAATIGTSITKGTGRVLIVGGDINNGSATAASFTHHATSPAVGDYQDVIARQLAIAATYRYSSPDALSGDSADAKEVEKDDQRCELIRQEGIWREVETRLARLVVEWANQNGPLTLPVPEVAVSYRYVEPRRNSLQDAQAKALTYSLGHRSIVRDVETYGQQMTEADKLEQMQKNQEEFLAWRAALGGVVPPGMDQLASYMGLADTPTEGGPGDDG